VSTTFEEVPRQTSFARRWTRTREAIVVLIYQQLLWLYFLSW
jgi:hypothetical protein